MPRPPRVGIAGGLYHALNRGNLRATIFFKKDDYLSFEKILEEGLEKYEVELFSYQLMPNHFHLVLRPGIDGEMGHFMKWVVGTHIMRYHAHYKTGGQGHVYQQRFKSFPIQDDDHFITVCRYVERNALRARVVRRAENWQFGSLWRWLQKPPLKPTLLSKWPVPRVPNWVTRVNAALAESELKAIRTSAQRGRPLGTEDWVKSTAKKYGLASTLRPRGRPRKHPEANNPLSSSFTKRLNCNYEKF